MRTSQFIRRVGSSHDCGRSGQPGIDRPVSRHPIDEPISAERLSGLVGLIYDGANDPAQWPIAMEAIRTELKFHKPALDLLKLSCGDVRAIGLAGDTRAIGTMSFGRHESAGPIGEREIAVAHLLIPHLQRAATINRMLDGAALARATFETTLDHLAVPILLVNASGHIVHANPAARHLLDRATLIRSVDGLLSAATLGASSVLNAAIAQASQDDSVMGHRALGIPVSGPDKSSGALHVLPLRQSQPAAASGPVAAVFVAQADTPFVAPTPIVTALFDLTPAEARVFDHLVAGHSTAQTAAALGVGQSTIKTHILRVYAKTGVHRQADLVRIAASLAIPVMA